MQDNRERESERERGGGSGTRNPEGKDEVVQGKVRKVKRKKDEETLETRDLEKWAMDAEGEEEELQEIAAEKRRKINGDIRKTSREEITWRSGRRRQRKRKR